MVNEKEKDIINQEDTFFDGIDMTDDDYNDFTDVRGLGGCPGLAFKVSVNDNLEVIRGRVIQ